MKLSIAWIFDHISVSWKDVNIADLVQKFNVTTAEIESYEHINIDLSSITIVKITEFKDNKFKAYSHELKKSIILPERTGVFVDHLYLVKKEKNSFRWANLIDLGGSKEGLLNNIWCHEEELTGSWKNNFEDQDWILTVDNSALTHRPDMWGHRGFAREIAAILNKKLISEEQFLSPKPIKHYDNNAPVTATNPFNIEISYKDKADQVCKRFAGIYFDSIDNMGSIINMAARLARVDSKPVGAIVDTTNYVMYDLGQPMHAFDASNIDNKKIVARFAYTGEKIKLLDGDEISLIDTDLVIADTHKPLALAGIMGGLDSSITKDTKSVFIESANFEASAIRKTSTRVKKRTEASARFEKSLDPNQNTQAILRFLKILSDYNIHYSGSDSIVSLGKLVQEKFIEVDLNFINKRIGSNVNSDSVKNILDKLGFGVQETQDINNNIIYTITVPTFRSTKDVTLPEDIVEEIGRFVGYDNINYKAPTHSMEPFDISKVRKVRDMKRHMAYSLNMHEAQTYAFFDEEFLRKLKYEPTDYLEVANPISENYRKLITSLAPNLLKCIYNNEHKQELLNFFEYNKVWFLENNIPVESVELAGIFFDSKKSVDFYDYKFHLNSLFELLKIDITWSKPRSTLDFWYDINQTAELSYQGRVMGTAGKLSPEILKFIGTGDGFVFELDANFLITFVKPDIKFTQLAKYPESELDISLLVDQKVTAAELSAAISLADSKIQEVELLDFFHKEEWGTKKSLTFRYVAYDDKGTMTKQEIDEIVSKVSQAVQKLGAQIR